MRLIDAENKRLLRELWTYHRETGIDEAPFEDATKALEVAPTIGGWIPIDERLPEEEGWYLVTIQNDKTRKRRTENDLFAIGIAEAHKHTPYKFCKDGHRQTVIAWMPLPEPYKYEEADDEESI